jgi:hypothetical protein
VVLPTPTITPTISRSGANDVEAVACLLLVGESEVRAMMMMMKDDAMCVDDTTSQDLAHHNCHNNSVFLSLPSTGTCDLPRSGSEDAVMMWLIHCNTVCWGRARAMM